MAISSKLTPGLLKALTKFSTAAERAQWAEVPHKLESALLADGVHQQGEAWFKRLIDSPVVLCSDLVSESDGIK